MSDERDKDRGEYEKVEQEQLEESLIVTAPGLTAPTEAVPMIEVVAPATLPEGYKFDAQIGGRGRSFAVTVPPGGVAEGQKFSVPLTQAENIHGAIATQRLNIPVGDWRDGMCDCCKYGCIHSTVCNAFWFPYCTCTILLAQVMTRMKLDLLGNPVSAGEAPKTFRILLFVVLYQIFVNKYLFNFLVFFLLTCPLEGGSSDSVDRQVCPGSEGLATVIGVLQPLTTLALIIYTVIMMTKTRSYIRSKYGIPERFCKGMEDLCCSLWCSCCTVAQMARHTSDYDVYRGMCCSNTGVPDHAPEVV